MTTIFGEFYKAFAVTFFCLFLIIGSIIMILNHRRQHDLPRTNASLTEHDKEAIASQDRLDFQLKRLKAMGDFYRNVRKLCGQVNVVDDATVKYPRDSKECFMLRGLLKEAAPR